VRGRKLLRIARWEVTKNAGGIDRRTILIAFVAIVLLGLVAPLAASGGGVGLEDGLYRVASDEDSPYHDVVEADETFRVVPDAGRDAFREGDVELLIDGDTVRYGETAKAEAAYDAFRDSVQRYNNRQLNEEANRTAAFPVSVVVDFRQQAGLGDQLRVDDGDGDDDDGTGTDGTGPDGGGGDGTGSDGTGSDGTGSDGTDTGSDGSGSDGTTTNPGAGGLSPFGGDESIAGSPSDISPPFPFQSLVLAFLFIIPLNFVIQAYGSTMLSERINRRGELLLVSPVSRFDIICGKTLPYFLGAMAVEGAIAVGLVYLTRGTIGGFISILAVIPLVALFLGATFLGAMFARSFKELTFLTVTITVGLTAYAFVPAIFSDVNAIALISPLTLVVRDLQGESIAVGEFVFSTTPPLLTAMVFFGLGTGLYREEDMFDQRAVSGKVLDSLVGLIPGSGHTGVLPVRLQWIAPFDVPTLERYLSVSVVTIVLIPFIFVSQLVAIALLFALGEISIVLVLVVVAIVEEIAKSLHIYAAFEHRRFSRTSTVALALGVCSGLGFFLGEKLALLAQLVGLQNLAVGEAGLQGGVAAGGPLLLVFLLAPLVLHTVTAAISAVGASRGKRQYAIAVSVAMVVHFLYNWTVVSSVA
jgi:ABC-type Na+ efflux pump permease subunit